MAPVVPFVLQTPIVTLVTPWQAITSSTAKDSMPGSSSLRIQTDVHGIPKRMFFTGFGLGDWPPPIQDRRPPPCALPPNHEARPPWLCPTSRLANSTVNSSSASQVSLSIIGIWMIFSVSCGSYISVPSVCWYLTPCFACPSRVQYFMDTGTQGWRLATTFSSTAPAHSSTTCLKSLKPNVISSEGVLPLPPPAALCMIPARYCARDFVCLFFSTSLLASSIRIFTLVMLMDLPYLT
mmetsp:Transcript_23266/g.40929  ORF Transcript_23266/g.40929 Transcript_23266/m.40929 type:complete len:237 (+) Transcript_23266:1166-1876(+)